MELILNDRSHDWQATEDLSSMKRPCPGNTTLGNQASIFYLSVAQA